VSRVFWRLPSCGPGRARRILTTIAGNFNGHVDEAVVDNGTSTGEIRPHFFPKVCPVLDVVGGGGRAAVGVTAFSLARAALSSDAGPLHSKHQSISLYFASCSPHTIHMTRFAIDAATAIRLAQEHVNLSDEHHLVAPKILHSHALSILYREVRAGETSRGDALETLRGITSMRIRLLGDRVSRATAWKIAESRDWVDTNEAEYLAVAQLQADYFVTVDADLRERIKGIVPLATWESLVS